MKKISKMFLVLALALSTIVFAAPVIPAQAMSASEVIEVGNPAHSWKWRTWSKDGKNYFKITHTYTHRYTDGSTWKQVKAKRYRYWGSVSVNDKDNGQVTWSGQKKLLNKSNKWSRTVQGSTDFDPRKKTQSSSGSGSNTTTGPTQSTTTSSYSQKAYEYAAARNAFAGIVNLNYATDATITATKGVFIQRLYNEYKGKIPPKNVSSSVTISDIPTSSEYRTAVLWAYSIGIVDLQTDYKYDEKNQRVETKSFGVNDTATPEYRTGTLKRLVKYQTGQTINWDNYGSDNTRNGMMVEFYQLQTMSWLDFDPISTNFGRSK